MNKNLVQRKNSLVNNFIFTGVGFSIFHQGKFTPVEIEFFTIKNFLIVIVIVIETKIRR